MRIEVRLFAVAKELAGGPILAVDLADGASVGDLRRALGEVVPPLRPMLPALRLAIGREYADDDATIRPGDEVALIPPVSGG